MVAVSQSMENYYSALSVFSQNMGHPQPIEIIIIKKCPKLLRIYATKFCNFLWVVSLQFQLYIISRYYGMVL